MAPTDPQTATRRDIGRGLEGPDLAAHLAAQGYPLLPLAPRSKNPWGWLLIREGRTEDGERGSNKVLLRHPFSPADIRSLAAEFPTMQWGLLLDGSGIAVLDLDDVPAILKALGHAPPAGPTVTTRRGLQVYMSLDGNRSGILKGRTVFYAPGSGEQVGELKTAGFVVLPGSKHPKGGRYRWVTGLAMGEVPLLPVPDWLAERCRDKRRGNITHPRTPTRTREGLSSPQEPGPTETEKTESIQTSVYSPVLPLSVSPGTESWDWTKEDLLRVVEGNEEYVSRLMAWASAQKGGKGKWQGVGRKFRCLLEHEHANQERGSLSAAVFREEAGKERLRYHCFLGHGTLGSRQHAWNLVYMFVALVTGDTSVLAEDGLTKGEYKAWSARSLFDLGIIRRTGIQDLREPKGPDAVQTVWQGFLLLLESQGLHDTRAIYAAVFGRNFAARWCGLSPATVQQALQGLCAQKFLVRRGKTKGGALAYAVGPAAFKDFPHEMPWRE